MKLFTFEIPSTCTEIVEVKANTLEEAIQSLKEGEGEGYVPEVEWTPRIDDELGDYLRDEVEIKS